MKTSVTGYPNIGANREMKFANERFFRSEIGFHELLDTAKKIAADNYQTMYDKGIDIIPSNDFTLYDNMLDTMFFLGAVPERFRSLGLSKVDTYYAIARGYQGDGIDVRPLPMKKWFNTNYHYIVPEIEDDMVLSLSGTKPFYLYQLGIEMGIKTKPVLMGPFTFLKLARYTGEKTASDFVCQMIEVYSRVLERFSLLGAEWVQFDEPCLVNDLTWDDVKLFTRMYSEILRSKCNVKVLCQTYFGDVRDCYIEMCSMDFDGIGIDFIEGDFSHKFIKTGFPKEKVLFAGVVSGRNVWRNNYKKTLECYRKMTRYGSGIVLTTSCSLLHVPYSLKNERKISDEQKKYLAFAEEKLDELAELKSLTECDEPENTDIYRANRCLYASARTDENVEVRNKVRALADMDFERVPGYNEREKIQKISLHLPVLPMTTVGSFPQTDEVRAIHSSFRRGEINESAHDTLIEKKITACIEAQEKLGLDVFVNGEYERTDMVEYFGERLDGFICTENGWVQSYGNCCVRPPIIWGDVSRGKPITVKWTEYAQSMTNKPVKGIVTGPVTMLNWSFAREDISLKDCAYQIALALRDEVLDLEASGIRVIQIDEAAFRERLPIRIRDRKDGYLKWAVGAFRIVQSELKPETQVHIHICYSEVKDIIKELDMLDCDVLNFEDSRSGSEPLSAFMDGGFRADLGPGVYDTHSPRIPSVSEIKQRVSSSLEKIPLEKLWVNPDCGLKARTPQEAQQSLTNMTAAVREIREELANTVRLP